MPLVMFRNLFVALLAKQEVASVYTKDQLATYKKKMKEYSDKNKATDRHVSVGDIVYVYRPKLKTPKTRKKLQEKYYGPYAVVRFTNLAGVILRNLATGRTLKKSINISRLKVGYVRAEVNNWDLLDIDSDEEELEEEDMPPGSFAPCEEEAPNQCSQASQALDNPPNPTQQPSQPNQQNKPTTTAQDRFEAKRPILATPPTTRSKSRNSPSKISGSYSQTTKSYAKT